MNQSFLVSPLLNQAFESGSSGAGFSNGITRRSFLKRTGAASVATLVAWNAVQQRAGATETNGGSAENSGSGSHRMCAVAPPSQDTLIGHVTLVGGGYIFLYYQETGCIQANHASHNQRKLSSLSRLRAEGWIPEKDDTIPWICIPQVADNEAWEINQFVFTNGQISRVGKRTLPLTIAVRHVIHLPDAERHYPADSIAMPSDFRHNSNLY